MKNKTKSKLSILLIIICVVTLTASLGTVLVMGVGSSRIKLDETKLANPSCSLTITDMYNNSIFDESSLNIIKTTDISEPTKQSFVVLEDKRFYEHHGVDIRRIGGALVQNIKSASYKQGASTITQQLIKNTHLTNEKTMKRKLNEISLSLQLEKKYSKEQILNMYLNTIYFGSGAYGLEAASKTYFSKNASQLSISEAAILAGIIKSPSKYNPSVNLDKALERRNLVLNLLLANEIINESQYYEAINEQIVISEINNTISQATNYVDLVMFEASKLLGITEQELIHMDVNISTFYDKVVDDRLKQAINNDTTTTLKGDMPLKLGIVADNSNGAIIAYYGLGNVVNIKRQIGSTAKPLAVYLPAIDKGIIHTSTPVIDEPISIAGYSPSNYGDHYQGIISIREAVKRSSNVVAVNVLNSITPKVGAEYMNELGINIPTKEQNLPMALGSVPKGIDLLELTNAYMTMANYGNRTSLSTIKYISSNGINIYEKDMSSKKVVQQDSCYLVTDMLIDTVKSGTASAFNGIDYQLAAKTGTVGMQNSPDNTDALVVSYTTAHTVTVWLGADTTDPLAHEVTGGTVPIAISTQVYDTLYSDFKPSDFYIPDSVTAANIDITEQKNNKLLLANEYTPSIEKRNEKFALRFMPTAHSDRYYKPSTPIIHGELIDNELFITFDKQIETDYIMSVETDRTNEIIQLDVNQTRHRYILNYETIYKFSIIAISRNSGEVSNNSNVLEYYVTSSILNRDFNIFDFILNKKDNNELNEKAQDNSKVNDNNDSSKKKNDIDNSGNKSDINNIFQFDKKIDNNKKDKKDDSSFFKQEDNKNELNNHSKNDEKQKNDKLLNDKNKNNNSKDITNHDVKSDLSKKKTDSQNNNETKEIPNEKEKNNSIINDEKPIQPNTDKKPDEPKLDNKQKNEDETVVRNWKDIIDGIIFE